MAGVAVAKAVAWIRAQGFGVYVDQSAIDALARRELGARGRDPNAERIAITHIAGEEPDYVATYRLDGDRIAVFTYEVDSVLRSFAVTDGTKSARSTHEPSDAGTPGSGDL